MVRTTSGRVSGMLRDGVHVYKGIPYAAPPVGERRFLPPAPPASWGGVRAMVDPGPRAPQPIRIMIPELGDALTGSGPTGEDCLRLHVWTPGPSARGARRPVVVYFHGGGFRSGSANSIYYDGTTLARNHDVVVVTVNHRLNALGYLYLEKLAGGRFAQSGNAGLLDLVAALRWVRDNIAEFGGDPGSVTIMGQSGGGGKVSMLTATPEAKGLFHRAIIMSTIIESGVRAVDPDQATALAAQLLQRLGVTAPRIAELQRVPAAAIMDALTGGGAAQGTMPDEQRGGDISARFYPVVDGHTLPSHPFDPVASPLSAAVPILCGSNETEGVPYADLDDPFWRGEIETDEALRGRVRTVLRVDDTDADRVIALYRRNRPAASRGDLALIIAADNSPTRLASYVFADRKFAQGGAPAYMYYFDWRSPVRGGKLRTMHSMELPFVFDHVDQVRSLTGSDPDRRAIASRMSGAFMAFARTGVPAVEGLPPWTPYDPATRATMMFGHTTRLVGNPYGQERRLLEELRARHAITASLRLGLVYTTPDVPAASRFWRTLGGAVTTIDGGARIDVAGVRVRLVPGPASGSSAGSVVDHVAFRVPSLAPVVAALAAAGIRVEQPPQFPGTAQAFTPDGDKVELFDNTSPFTGFEVDGEATSSQPQRHNAPVAVLTAHHLHFYLPDGADASAREWYRLRFGGTVGRRYRYAALDFPVINLNFSTAPAPAGPTSGRTLDRIAFGVPNLEQLCARLVTAGDVFARPYRRNADGSATALLVDPWGTSIELFEAAA